MQAKTVWTLESTVREDLKKKKKQLLLQGWSAGGTIASGYDHGVVCPRYTLSLKFSCSGVENLKCVFRFSGRNES